MPDIIEAKEDRALCSIVTCCLLDQVPVACKSRSTIGPMWTSEGHGRCDKGFTILR